MLSSCPGCVRDEQFSRCCAPCAAVWNRAVSCCPQSLRPRGSGQCPSPAASQESLIQGSCNSPKSHRSCCVAGGKLELHLTEKRGFWRSLCRNFMLALEIQQGKPWSWRLFVEPCMLLLILLLQNLCLWYLRSEIVSVCVLFFFLTQGPLIL